MSGKDLEMETEPTFDRSMNWRILGATVLTAVVTVGPALAVLDLSNITDLLNDFIGILPTFLNLLIAYAPIAVGGSIIGAIIAFPKKILEMFDKLF